MSLPPTGGPRTGSSQSPLATPPLQRCSPRHRCRLLAVAALFVAASVSGAWWLLWLLWPLLHWTKASGGGPRDDRVLSGRQGSAA